MFNKTKIHRDRKVGLGIAGMISFFSGATGMIVGIVIVIAVLVLLETLVLGSLIVYRVAQNSYEHYIETAEEYE